MDFGQVSQCEVARRAGLLVRFETIESEHQQTSYVPLIAYQDYLATGAYTQPNKQL